MSRARFIAIGILLFTAPALSARGEFYTYFSVVGGGAQFQIGDGLPVPLQNPKTAMGGPIGTWTMFPPLLIPVTPHPGKALVKLGTVGGNPRKFTMPPGLFRRKAPGRKALAGPAGEVRTNIEFSAPAQTLGSVVFKAGGRTGPPIATYLIGKAAIQYTKTVAQFGGPMQTRLAPVTPPRKFVYLGNPPCKHPAFGGLDVTCDAQLLAWSPGPLAVFGAPVGFTQMTSAPPPMSPNLVHASIPSPDLLIAKSASAAMTGVATDHATSWGFPWTTGRVIVSQSVAIGGYEVFTITGKDSRVNGFGTISLVSGALSTRKFSGPNANRAWMRITMPEPGAAISAVAALAVLGLCQGAARRRRDGP